MRFRRSTRSSTRLATGSIAAAVFGTAVVAATTVPNGPLTNSPAGAFLAALSPISDASAQGRNGTPFIYDRRRSAYACERERIPVPTVENNDGRPVEEYEIQLEADKMDAVDRNTVTLSGRAEVVQGPQSIGADTLTYRKDADSLSADGNVVVYTPFGDRLNADNLEIELESFVGEAGNTRYKMAERAGSARSGSSQTFDPDTGFSSFDSDFVQDGSSNFSDSTYGDEEEKVEVAAPGEAIVRARGSADKVYFEGHDLMRLENVSYTTCVEGQDDVIIKAGEMELDQGTNVGTARDVTLRFMDVPIFYLPYMTFPISSERKTGFLFPGIGRDAKSGIMIEAPWYWNISPNLDATLTPRFHEKRGLQLAGEFRYLTEQSRGVIRAEVLPSDDVFGDDRSAVSFRHDQQFTDRLTGYIDVQHASDDRYFDDFETDVNITSATHLPERAELRYRGDIWTISGLFAGYQTLDDEIPEISRPYDRLPQLSFDANIPQLANGLKLDFDGEVVRFDRDAGVTGTRIDLTPSISFPIRPVYGFVVPKLSLRATKYSLDGVEAGANDSPSRTVPIFSVDSGLYFERNATWAGKNAIQTLEPRMMYVYIPDEDQDDIPNFDTSSVSLNNFSNIFRENRFFGADRVGDTNQVTLGLTTRMLDADTGVERLRAGIGQVFYLEDRFVTNDLSTRQDRDTSDLLGEVSAQLNDDWKVDAFLQYDTEDSEVEFGSLAVDFDAGDRRRFGASYRYNGDTNEQLTVNLDWPINNRWDFRLRERYSISDSENLETSLGLSYEACCWGVDFVYQRRLDRDQEYKNAFFMIFELTGLGRVRAGL